jgi:hypothetical protein
VAYLPRQLVPTGAAGAYGGEGALLSCHGSKGHWMRSTTATGERSRRRQQPKSACNCCKRAPPAKPKSKGTTPPFEQETHIAMKKLTASRL